VALPEQLLLSDLLRLRVRCDQGLDHGPGVLGWMHPPVHRLLGWASRPSAFRAQRAVWRLNQLRGISDSEAFVKGQPAAADAGVLEQLPTLIQATLLGAEGRPLGRVADAAVQLGSGRILHYLIARSDPRLPGSSRWRLTPDRIVDQRSGAVITSLETLDDLPLARASVRQELLRRSRRWREQMSEETSRLREQFEEAGGRLEERVEGWLEEPPWEELRERGPRPPAEPAEAGRWNEDEPVGEDRWRPGDSDPLEGWDEEPPLAAAPPGDHGSQGSGYGPWDDEDRSDARADDGGEPTGSTGTGPRRRPLSGPLPDDPPRRSRRDPDRYRGRDDDDPWV